MGDIASIVILLLRVMALVPNRCYIFFIILHTIIFVARLIFAVFDVMSTNIFVNSFGVCMFKEKYKVTLFLLLLLFYFIFYINLFYV